MSRIKIFLVSIASIVLLIVLMLAVDYGYLHWFQFIEPQKEDARHKVFKATRSYNEGKVQDLIKLRQVRIDIQVRRETIKLKGV